MGVYFEKPKRPTLAISLYHKNGVSTTMIKLNIGDVAPDFAAVTDTDDKIKLSD
jgi:hypothetical protein